MDTCRPQSRDRATSPHLTHQGSHNRRGRRKRETPNSKGSSNVHPCRERLGAGQKLKPCDQVGSGKKLMRGRRAFPFTLCKRPGGGCLFSITAFIPFNIFSTFRVSNTT